MVQSGLVNSVKTLTKRHGADKRLPVGRMRATQDAAETLSTVKACAAMSKSCATPSQSGDRLRDAGTAQIGPYRPLHHIIQGAW
jgi:hypothetical protein